MIKLEIEGNLEGVNILIDSAGVDELIGYLEYVRTNDESFHLLAGNELDESPSSDDNRTVKHVKIIFLPEDQ